VLPGNPLSLAPDLPLGPSEAPRHNIRNCRGPGESIFLYTDGLVERRDRPISAGIAQLAAALTYGPADTMCATAMARLLHNQAARDDIAALAVRRI